jgi:hypothetical protein
MKKMAMQGRVVTGTPLKGPKGLQGGAVGVGLWDRPSASSPPRLAGKASLSQVNSSSSSISSPFIPT